MNIARLENANISDISNTLLTTYFKIENVAFLKKEKDEYREKIKIIDKRLKDLKKKGIFEERTNQINTKLFDELFEHYKKRRSQIHDPQADLLWITGEKNKSRCKILKKDPMQILHELEIKYQELKE